MQTEDNLHDISNPISGKNKKGDDLHKIFFLGTNKKKYQYVGLNLPIVC